MQHKILCMYSGGLDSAGALWELLTNPKYNEYTILVHHINIINHERRVHAEKVAVDETLALFKTLCKKTFYYSNSTIDFSCLPYPSNLPFDTDIYGFIGGNLAIIDRSIKFLASGSTKNDKEKVVENAIFNKRRDAIMDALYLGRTFDKQFGMLYPVEHLTKQEIYEMLPKEISSKTWSCRRPQYLNNKIQECGICHSCIELSKFKK